MSKTKQKIKRKKLVCVRCGHEVSKCDENSLCGVLGSDRENYFCGNCGEYGSHQKAVEASKWIKAQKLMGLPGKINSYD